MADQRPWVVCLRRRSNKRNILSREFAKLSRAMFVEFARELHHLYKTHTFWADDLDLVVRRGDDTLATLQALNHQWRWDVPALAEQYYDLVT